MTTGATIKIDRPSAEAGAAQVTAAAERIKAALPPSDLDAAIETVAAPGIMDELELIQARDPAGLLDPRRVVDYARDPDTALHRQFEWDDSLAAEQHRLWQARQIIRLRFTVFEEDGPPVRTFVSLRSDRMAGRGYRALSSVLSDRELRQVLLDEALAELRRARERYTHLKELSGVWRELRKAEQRRLRRARSKGRPQIVK